MGKNNGGSRMGQSGLDHFTGIYRTGGNRPGKKCLIGEHSVFGIQVDYNKALFVFITNGVFACLL